MAEELKACPFCSCTDIGEVTINLILEQRHRRFKVYCKACQCRTSEHKTRKEARIYWNTRDQLPNQGGEAVAWRVTGREGLTVTAQYPAWAETDCLLTITPLYTHPTDKVADGVTVSRERLEHWADKLEDSESSGYGWEDALAAELRALLNGGRDE